MMYTQALSGHRDGEGSRRRMHLPSVVDVAWLTDQTLGPQIDNVVAGIIEQHGLSTYCVYCALASILHVKPCEAITFNSCGPLRSLRGLLHATLPTAPTCAALSKARCPSSSTYRRSQPRRGRRSPPSRQEGRIPRWHSTQTTVLQEQRDSQR